MSQKSEFEVYVCSQDGVIIYVGEGRFGRHKHCTSGTSHVYALNKLHFEGVEIDVEVVKVFKTKKEAQEYEQLLIDKYLPAHNIKGTAWFKKQQCDSMTVKHTRETYLQWMKHNLKCHTLSVKVIGFIDEIFNFYGNKNVVEGKFRFETDVKYGKMGLIYLKEFVKGLRYAKSSQASAWVVLTYKYFKTQLNLDPVEMCVVEITDKNKAFWTNLDLDTVGRKM